VTNQYSVEIHQYISDRIAIATRRKKKAGAANEPATRRFYEGQLFELDKIREYLAQNIDLKTQKYY